ncbi:MAG: hypothetical protein JFR38_03640 [Muribaculaceae bacterium]|nr:hypothetical protein [Muribaculaceae bacterium]
MEYNEDDAIRRMRGAVAGAEAYDDDQLLNLIDIIFDYYDENGDLEIDIDSDDSDDDIAAIAAYATRLLAKDAGNEISPEHIAPLIEAEIDYELSLI